jgi:acyl-CoA thioesterase FadM
MDITSLTNLLSESAHVSCLDDGLRVVIEPAWIVSGESKLSYTTLLRLVECCREHHWQKDIRCRLNGHSIDTTCKTIHSRFIKSIEASQSIDIVYSVEDVRTHSYRMRLLVLDSPRLIQYAEIELVLVFVLPDEGDVVPPPSDVINYLQRRVTESSQAKDRVLTGRD